MNIPVHAKINIFPAYRTSNYNRLRTKKNFTRLQSTRLLLVLKAGGMGEGRDTIAKQLRETYQQKWKL